MRRASAIVITALAVAALSGCTALTGDTHARRESSTSSAGGASARVAPATTGTTARATSTGRRSGGPTTTASSPAAARAADVTFAQLMLLHEAQGLDLADFALHGHGASPAVRRVAAEVERTGAPAVEQLQGWLTAWHAPGYPPERLLRSSGLLPEGELREVAGLRGRAFDVRWSRVMLAHDRAGIALARQVRRTTQSPEVSAWVDRLVPVLEARLARLGPPAR